MNLNVSFPSLSDSFFSNKTEKGQEMIVAVADVEGLILDRLDFLAERMMNQVSVRYRNLMNQRYLARYPSSSDETVFRQMMEEGNLLGCRWMYARKPELLQLIYLFHALHSKNVDLLSWFLQRKSEGKLGINPQFLSCHLNDALATNCQPMIADFLQRLQAEVPNWMDFFNPGQLKMKRLELITVQWLVEYSQAQGRPWDWEGYFVLCGRDLIRSRRMDLFYWLIEFTGLRLNLTKSTVTYFPQIEILEWARTEYGFDYSEDYPRMWNSASSRQDLPMAEWILQQGYSPSLTAENFGQLSVPLISLIYQYGDSSLLRPFLSSLYVTRTMRHPPYPATHYQWIQSLLS